LEAPFLNADDEDEDGYDADVEENDLEEYVDVVHQQEDPLEARNLDVGGGWFEVVNVFHDDETFLFVGVVGVYYREVTFVLPLVGSCEEQLIRVLIVVGCYDDL
jgi:hypothetical protein